MEEVRVDGGHDEHRRADRRCADLLGRVRGARLGTPDGAGAGAGRDARRGAGGHRVRPGRLPARRPGREARHCSPQYGLRAVGGFVPVVLHDPAATRSPTVGPALAAFAAATATTLVLAAATGADGYDERPALDEEGWRTLLDNLDRIRDAAAGSGCTPPCTRTSAPMVETPRRGRAGARRQRASRSAWTPATCSSAAPTRSRSPPRSPNRIAHVAPQGRRRRRWPSGCGRASSTYTDAVRDRDVPAARRRATSTSPASCAALDAAGYTRLVRPGAGRDPRAEPPADGGPLADVRASLAFLPRQPDERAGRRAVRRDHDGPDRRGPLPAADRRARCGRCETFGKFLGGSADQRRGRRRPARPAQRGDHPHRRRPVRRVPPRRAARLRRRRPLRHAGAGPADPGHVLRDLPARRLPAVLLPPARRRPTWRSTPTSSTSTRSARPASSGSPSPGCRQEPSRSAHARRAGAPAARRGITVLDLDYRPMFWPSPRGGAPRWIARGAAATSPSPSATSTSARSPSASATRGAAARRAARTPASSSPSSSRARRACWPPTATDGRRGAAGAGRGRQRPRRRRRLRRRAVPRPARRLGPGADAALRQRRRRHRRLPAGLLRRHADHRRGRGAAAGRRARCRDERYQSLAATPRARARPEAIAEARRRRAAARRRCSASTGRLMIIAADHPARGALGVRRPADWRWPTAPTCSTGSCLALARPGVDGVLGTADILEDLLLLGALDGKVVIGSMNRGGLAGAVVRARRPVHRLRRRRDRRDGLRRRQDAAAHRPRRRRPPSRTLEACAQAVDRLAGQRLMAMVEPFISRRVDGRVRNDLTAEAWSASVGDRLRARRDLRVHLAEAAGRRRDGARSWPRRTLPALLLGGEVAADQDATFDELAQGAGAARRARAWSSAARCSTRRTTTWPPPSTPRWACCDGAR